MSKVPTLAIPGGPMAEGAQDSPPKNPTLLGRKGVLLVHALWIAFLFAVCRWAWKQDASDSLFYSGIASGILGAAVTLFQRLTAEPALKVMVFLGFVAATWVGSNAAYRASKESDEVATKTKTKVEGIDKIVADVHTATLENSRMNRETLEAASKIIEAETEIKTASSNIERLAREGISTATGGDSFAYVSIETNTGILVLTHQGRHPLSDLSIRIADLEQRNDWGRTHTEPMLAPGSAKMIGNIGDRTSFRSNIFFFARNGSWSQMLRARKVHGRWIQACVVNRHTEDGKGMVLLRQGDQKLLDEPLS